MTLSRHRFSLRQRFFESVFPEWSISVIQGEKEDSQAQQRFKFFRVIWHKYLYEPQPESQTSVQTHVRRSSWVVQQNWRHEGEKRTTWDFSKKPKPKTLHCHQNIKKKKNFFKFKKTKKTSEEIWRNWIDFYLAMTSLLLQRLLKPPGVWRTVNYYDTYIITLYHVTLTFTLDDLERMLRDAIRHWLI